MIFVTVSEFRANMYTILQRVQQGEVVHLQIDGKAVAKLVPPDYTRVAAQQTLEVLRQTATVGDILSPLDEAWNADS